MIANAMAAFDNFCGIVGEAFNLPTNQKEGGFCVMLFQNIKQFRRVRRRRIIKGEIECVVRFSPKALRKQSINEFWNPLWIKHSAEWLRLSELLQEPTNVALVFVASYCTFVCKQILLKARVWIAFNRQSQFILPSSLKAESIKQ